MISLERNKNRWSIQMSRIIEKRLCSLKTKPHLCKKSWSNPYSCFLAHMMLSSSPFCQEFIHLLLIFSMNNFVPHKPPNIGKECLGWSRITWMDFSECNHSWTAACSLSLKSESESLEINKSTYHKKVIFKISRV